MVEKEYKVIWVRYAKGEEKLNRFYAARITKKFNGVLHEEEYDKIDKCIQENKELPLEQIIALDLVKCMA